MVAHHCVIFKILFIFLLCGSVICANSKNRQQRGCQIKIPTDIPKGEPLYLSGNPGRFRLFKPINQTNHLAVNSKLTLFCPGRRNTLLNSPNNSTELTCGSGNRFVNENGHEVNLSQFNCTRGIEGDLHMTREKCSSNRGYIYDIGFRIDSRNFLTVFKVCYDNSSETTFFSTHHINGPVVKYFVKDSRRRNFKTTGMSATTKADKVYNKKSQIDRFSDIFGTQQIYINNSMHLSRGHLTPDADFVFPNFQLATYFYVNVAPEFQSVNGGNWARIEFMARELASDYKSDFTIYTGIFETLSLPNRLAQPVEIFLDSNHKINVPKWFWKAIKNERLDAGIVMITLNNPFAKRDEIVEFCPNVCKRASLTSKHFEIIKKGYTFCCEVNAFKNAVHDLPRNFTAPNLLECAKANYLFDNEVQLQ